MTPAQTKTGTPRLSEIARHVVVPKGVVSTGWPSVRDKCREMGISFRPWQDPTGRVILAKRADGKYAATIGGTGLSIPRQVGKTFLVGAVIFALCLLVPNLTVIWTAHRLRTAEETFGKMQKFARRKKIAPHVSKVVLGSGEEEVQFKNGSRILFGARERGFGRGFDEVDVLVFDEAQILTDNALDDMVPAANQSRQPAGALMLFLGTPPKPTDPGEVFRRMRAEALTGEDDDTGWIEFGADSEARPAPPPAPLTASDWKQVAKANPSYPDDTPRESILRMRKKLGPEAFLREGLGIWDDDHRVGLGPVDLESKPTEPLVLAFDMNPERTMAAITVAWRGESGWHGEITHQQGLVDHRPGSDWLPGRLMELVERHKPHAVMVDPSSPAGSLIPVLEEAGLKVTKEPKRGTKDLLVTVTAVEMAQACGQFQDNPPRHVDQVGLNTAIAGAGKRDRGDGAWTWSRKGSSVDISPLIAVTLAGYGLSVYGPHEEVVPMVMWA